MTAIDIALFPVLAVGFLFGIVWIICSGEGKESRELDEKERKYEEQSLTENF